MKRLAWTLLAILATQPSTGWCEEPFEQFLSELKNRGYYDTALTYLDMLEADRSSADALKGSIDLERGLLRYQAAAKLSPSNSDRNARLDAAEADLRSFMKSNPSHPRRGEARLKLGELLLTRADEAKRLAGDTEEDISDAIEFYNSAHQLFEESIKELAAIVDTMRGARIDPNDKAKVAYRQKVIADIRQAQLLSAKAVEERGKSHAASSPQRKSDLQKALTMYSDLYKKERDLVGIRNYALYYRSMVQAELGENSAAIDGLQRVADLTGVDVLRPLQTIAVKSLIELLSEEKKYEIALNRGLNWIGQLRPNERETIDTVDLKLTVDELRYKWATLLKESDRGDRAAGKMIRDARADVRQLIRIAGPHEDRARALLADLGVGSADEEVSLELPEVKDFAEALAIGTQRYEQANTESIALETINSTLTATDTSKAEISQLETQAAAIEEKIETLQTQGITLLEHALVLFDRSEGDLAELFDARFKLALLYLKQQQPWKAIAIGEMLARKNPSSDEGLNAAAICLAGFSDLLTTAGPAQQAEYAEMLEPLSVYLSETWPESQEAAAAAAATVQLALVAKDWAKAESLLDKLPKDAPAAATTRRDVGIAYYGLYLSEKNSDEAAANANAQRATTQLELYVESLANDSAIDKPLESKTVDALNSLSKLYLDAGKVGQAQKLLQGGKNPTLSALEQSTAVAPRTKMESYRLAIQIAAARIGKGELTAEEAAKQIEVYIAAMNEAAAKAENGPAILNSVFVGMATDLNEQLVASKNTSDKKQLFGLLTLVANQAAKSDAFNVRYWAADTLITNATELAGTADAKDTATEAFTTASSIAESILATESSSPGFIDPPALITRVQMLSAKAKRGQGEYLAAIKILSSLLKEKAGLLDVQIEAAETLEAWGSAKPEYYKTAYAGYPSLSIWGWGKIAKNTLGNEKLSDQFFEARYRLALNMYRHGVATGDADQYSNAERMITQTISLYPDLGGPNDKKRFAALLKQIRQKAGK